MEIQNKVAIVTGASKGIGKATAEALLAEGVKVAGWSRSRPDIDHGDFLFVEADMSNYESVTEAWHKTRKHFGDFAAILVNNAGVGYMGKLEETPVDKWHELFNINVNGIFYATRQVLPEMKQHEEGYIFNISSGAGSNGIAGMTAYCGTKHAVRGISHALHNEVRNDGIKVTCLAPGSVHTHFARAMGMEPVKKNAMYPEDIAQSIVHALKMPENYHYLDMEVRPLQPDKT